MILWRLASAVAVGALVLGGSVACTNDAQRGPETVPAPPDVTPPEVSTLETATDPYRPVVHFTTHRNWLNDPNGPVYLDGRVHLFFQYNPDGTQWGNIGWGHAVSEDLISFEELPMALEATFDSMVFSGSTVWDAQETSGLCGGDGCLVAIYTGFSVEADTLLARQDQRLAVSRDLGATWEQYEGNPVIDLELADFRDPNVFWHEPSASWVMSVTLPLERRVWFYRSENLRDWEFLSEFGPQGAVEGIWECPVLMELAVDGDPENTQWVLKVDHNPGHVTVGSGAQYFVGDFDGRVFNVTDPPLADSEIYEPGDVDQSEAPPDAPQLPRWVDYGPDFYCAMPVSNGLPSDSVDGLGRTWIAWMSNWEYAADTPTGEWRGAMTIPRRVSLETRGEQVVLTQEPIAALIDRRTGPTEFSSDTVAELSRQVAEATVTGDVLDLEFSFVPGEAEEVGVALRASEDERITVSYRAAEREIVVDRTMAGNVGFHPSFPGRFAAPVRQSEEQITLRILLDRSSVEVFGPGGQPSITALAFPGSSSLGVEVFATGGSSGGAELRVWGLLPDPP